MILAHGIIGEGQPWWVLGFAFLIAHAVADYSLQSEFLAIGKNHRVDPGSLWLFQGCSLQRSLALKISK